MRGFCRSDKKNRQENSRVFQECVCRYFIMNEEPSRCFVWSDRRLDIRDFVDLFYDRLPLIAWIEELDNGNHDDDGDCAEKEETRSKSGMVYYIQSIHLQQRVVGKANDGQFISIPQSYPHKFHIIRTDGTSSKPMTVDEIVRVYMPADPRGTRIQMAQRDQLTTLSENLNCDVFGQLLVTGVYSEKFLLVAGLDSPEYAGCERRLTALPTYMPLQVTLPNASSMEELQSYQSQVASSISPDSYEENLEELLIFPDPPNDDVYEFVFPSTSFSCVAQDIKEDEDTETSNPEPLTKLAEATPPLLPQKRRQLSKTYSLLTDVSSSAPNVIEIPPKSQLLRSAIPAKDLVRSFEPIHEEPSNRQQSPTQSLHQRKNDDQCLRMENKVTAENDNKPNTVCSKFYGIEKAKTPLSVSQSYSRHSEKHTQEAELTFESQRQQVAGKQIKFPKPKKPFHTLFGKGTTSKPGNDWEVVNKARPSRLLEKSEDKLNSQISNTEEFPCKMKTKSSWNIFGTFKRWTAPKSTAEGWRRASTPTEVPKEPAVMLHPAFPLPHHKKPSVLVEFCDDTKLTIPLKFSDSANARVTDNIHQQAMTTMLQPPKPIEDETQSDPGELLSSRDNGNYPVQLRKQNLSELKEVTSDVLGFMQVEDTKRTHSQTISTIEQPVTTTLHPRTKPAGKANRDSGFDSDEVYITNRRYHVEQRDLALANLVDIPRDVSSLSVDEVARCLQLLNLSQYVTLFCEHDVDGCLLACLDHDVLIEDFNMKKFDAIKLLKFVRDGWRPKVERK